MPSILRLLGLAWIFCSIPSSAFNQNILLGQLLYMNFENDFNDHGPNSIECVPVNVEFGEGPGLLNQQSAYFSGDSSFIIIPDTPFLEPDFPFTIMFWIKLENVGPAIMTFDDLENFHSGFWFSFDQETNGIALNVGDGSSVTPEGRRSFVANYQMAIGEWYRVLGVLRAENDMSIWIDCHIETGFYDGSGGELFYSDAPAGIGRKDSALAPSWNYFNGYIDEIRIWDRELSYMEIQYLCDPDYGFEEIPTDEEPYEGPSDDFGMQTQELTMTECWESNITREISIYNPLGQLISIQNISSLEELKTHFKGLHVISYMCDNHRVTFKVIL